MAQADSKPDFTVTVGFKPLPNLSGSADARGVTLTQLGPQGGHRDSYVMTWEQWDRLVSETKAAKDFVVQRALPAPRP